MRSSPATRRRRRAPTWSFAPRARGGPGGGAPAAAPAARAAGGAPAKIKRRLRMPSRAADRLISDARATGSDALRRATCEIAELELASRGGGRGALAEDTAALIAITRIAA